MSKLYLNDLAAILQPLGHFSEQRCDWILLNIPPNPQKRYQTEAKRRWTAKDEKAYSTRREVLTAHSDNTFVCFVINADGSGDMLEVMSVVDYLFHRERLTFPISRLALYLAEKHSSSNADVKFKDDFYFGPTRSKIPDCDLVDFVSDKDVSSRMVYHYRAHQKNGNTLPQAVQAASVCAQELKDILIAEERRMCALYRIPAADMLKRIEDSRIG